MASLEPVRCNCAAYAADRLDCAVGAGVARRGDWADRSVGLDDFEVVFRRAMKSWSFCSRVLCVFVAVAGREAERGSVRWSGTRWEVALVR